VTQALTPHFRVIVLDVRGHGQSGKPHDPRSYGQSLQQAGVPFLLDACQAAGQWPLDVKQIGCDMLSVTGRKFLRGPRGTGFLYVRRSMIEKLEPPLLDLQAARLATRDARLDAPTGRCSVRCR
jgi:cysteine desulfurase / selenocysteine lyase